MFDFFDTTTALSIDELDVLDALPVHWVDTDVALATLIDEIGSVDMVALDTEFIKRTTYYPILALVQINTGRGIYLIDAPRLELTKLWQALITVPTMVWYACGEDLGIFYLLAKCPPLTNVFDVQIAIAYLTAKLQVGYSEAVSKILGLTLDKGESQSDWLVRPLSNEQQHYAVNDVRYLPILYTKVLSALDALGLSQYVIEDCRNYAAELHTTQNTPDNLLYLDYLAPMYTRRQIAALQNLVAWRESVARSTNNPRNFIISRQALREIILDLPKTMPLLARTTLHRSSLRRYGDEIIAIIRNAHAISEHALPELPPPTYISKDKPFKKALIQAIHDESVRTHIPENLLLKGRWINQLLYIVYQDLSLDALPDELQGYRRPWIKQTLLPLLRTYKAQINAGFRCSELQQP